MTSLRPYSPKRLINGTEFLAYAHLFRCSDWPRQQGLPRPERHAPSNLGVEPEAELNGGNDDIEIEAELELPNEGIEAEVELESGSDGIENEVETED